MWSGGVRLGPVGYLVIPKNPHLRISPVTSVDFLSKIHPQFTRPHTAYPHFTTANNLQSIVIDILGLIEFPEEVQEMPGQLKYMSLKTEGDKLYQPSFSCLLLTFLTSYHLQPPFSYSSEVLKVIPQFQILNRYSVIDIRYFCAQLQYQ